MTAQIKKVALVHDWLTNMGGAERVLIHLHELFPDAPVYTSMIDYTNVSQVFQDMDVRPSFLQKCVRPGKSNHQRCFPLMPLAFESFDLSGYDLVVSSSSSCAKGVITGPSAVHVCYCHSPMRYAWEFYHEYASQYRGLKSVALACLMHYMRQWDLASSSRVDCFVANSREVAGRIEKHYRRKAEVVHPPIRFEDFTKEGEGGPPSGDYYLVVSRLVPYKRVDIAVDACSELGVPLVVIGVGSELQNLQKRASRTVRFLGSQPDHVVREYYAGARALLFPGVEDFGLTPLEAQASGTPVIAYGRGGALETVLEGRTGFFFYEQNKDHLKNALLQLESTPLDSSVMREHASLFGVEAFHAAFGRVVESALCHE